MKRSNTIRQLLFLIFTYGGHQLLREVQSFAFVSTSRPLSRHAARSATTSSLSVSLSSSWAMNSTVALPNFGFLQEGAVSPNLQKPFRFPTRTPVREETKRFKVFCDLDGVLCDFAAGVTQVFDLEVPITSQNIDAMPRTDLWKRVQKADSFFEHLPWTTCGRQLWNSIAPLQPDILTGVPSYCVSPRFEKFAWCQRELAKLSPASQFKHVDKAGKFRTHHDFQTSQATTSSSTPASEGWTCHVITCWSERKHHESGPGRVLIDDRLDLKAAWEAKGGIFIHHITGNLDHTLRQLEAHGVLNAEEVERSRAAAEHDRLWRRASVLP